MEEPILNTNETPLKKAEFGLGGVILGLVFVVVVLLIFNYLNLINLPFNLPQKTQDKVVTSSTKLLDDSIKTVSNTIPGSQPISADLQEKAQKAGYSITWQGNVSDTTGKTVLFSKERLYSYWQEDKFGLTNNGQWFRGEFIELEKIIDSKDYYLVLFDPINKKTYKGRIKISEDAKAYSVNNEWKTMIYVDDLNFNSSDKINDNKKILSELNISLGELSNKDVVRIFSKKDIIIMSFKRYLLLESANKSADFSRVMEYDSTESKVPLIEYVVIRRFGGEKAL